MDNQYDFSDIAPFADDVFQEKMAQLVKEPGFEHAVKYVMPDVDFQQFAGMLLSIPDNEVFQRQVMYPFLQMLVDKTTAGVTVGGLDNIDKDKHYTFMSNHRDIVLDATLLNYCFLINGFPTSEVAIGNNLLIYEWITDLVKLNKSFIVKRNLRLTKALEAARQLSAYIHHVILNKHESLWIAQREGRCKDSNDMTQESLVKMLAIAGSGSFIDNLLQINITPVSISYEYDPNDYLKAKEFLLKRLDPEFKKSPHDDLLSMETGLLQPKGRVHFHVGKSINPALESLSAELDKQELSKSVCRIIDREIHSNYKIYPINYIAYDTLHAGDRFKERYSAEDAAEFHRYVESQLDKVDLTEISSLDRNYMREMMYTMYALSLIHI